MATVMVCNHKLELCKVVDKLFLKKGVLGPHLLHVHEAHAMPGEPGAAWRFGAAAGRRIAWVAAGRRIGAGLVVNSVFWQSEFVETRACGRFHILSSGLRTWGKALL